MTLSCVVNYLFCSLFHRNNLCLLSFLWEVMDSDSLFKVRPCTNSQSPTSYKSPFAKYLLDPNLPYDCITCNFKHVPDFCLGFFGSDFYNSSILHCAGDFDVPSSREDVDRDSSWNQWLRNEIHILFLEALEIFKVGHIPHLKTIMY